MFWNCFAAVFVASASRNPFMTTALAPHCEADTAFGRYCASDAEMYTFVWMRRSF
jgi:hypothetical protein